MSQHGPLLAARLLYRRIDQRLHRQRARQVLDVRARRRAGPALDDADEHDVVGGIDPEPRTRDAVPQERALTDARANARRLFVDRDVEAEAEARLLPVIADAELAGGLHCVR